jgi:hypothetical protein
MDMHTGMHFDNHAGSHVTYDAQPPIVINQDGTIKLANGNEIFQVDGVWLATMGQGITTTEQTAIHLETQYIVLPG